jgi:hypothetical protein
MKTESKRFVDKVIIPDNIVNNSSVFTAENSIIQGNKISSFNNSKKFTGKNTIDSKYSNASIFNRNQKDNSWVKNPELTTKNNSKKNLQIYLTETNETIIPKNRFNTSRHNETIDLFSNNKSYLKNNAIKLSLPSLKCYHHRKNEKTPDIFICDNLSMNPKILTKLYYKKNESIDEVNEDFHIEPSMRRINNRIRRQFKESPHEYLFKTKKINLINYKINLKKEALEEYKENMKSQLLSLNQTISQINNYKASMENTLFVKYNEKKREIDKELYNARITLDNQKNDLVTLLKEVNTLSLIVTKKEAIKKSYEKWLSFQILLKEGSEPKTKNIKEYLDENYGNNPIFENYDDFFIAFKEREDRNIRLLEREEKVIREKDKIKQEYEEFKNYVEKNIKISDLNLKEKEKVLDIVKARNKELKNILVNLEKVNNIKKRNNLSKSLKQKFKTSLNFDKQKNKEINIEDITLNSLGVYYCNLEGMQNMYQMINCIYYTIIKNDISGLDLPHEITYKIKNQILSKNQKALNQIKIIELSLIYINSSIDTRKNNDEDVKKLIKEIKNEIDLYRKSEKNRIYKEKEAKKAFEFMIKMEEKGKKIYFIPHKKVDNFPSGIYNRKRNISVNKNKNNIPQLFDFLYDNVSSN